MEELPQQEQVTETQEPMTQEKVTVTQEPVTSENEETVVTKEPMTQKNVVETQNLVVETQELANQDFTLLRINGDIKVQDPSKIIELDEEDEEAYIVAEEISLLKVEVNKWKYQATLHGKGMIPLPTHRKVIKELKEKWIEELTFQRFHWEKMQS